MFLQEWKVRKLASGRLTEISTSALKRWMIVGSEFTGLISEFETLYLPELDPKLNYTQHGKGLST